MLKCVCGCYITDEQLVNHDRYSITHFVYTNNEQIPAELLRALAQPTGI